MDRRGGVETAQRAGEILLATVRGERRPVMAWGNLPMLPHVMRQGTDDFPNRELQARAVEKVVQLCLEHGLREPAGLDPFVTRTSAEGRVSGHSRPTARFSRTCFEIRRLERSG